MPHAATEIQLGQLDRNIVEDLLHKAPGHSTTSILNWVVQPISIGRGPATSGIYRLSGTGQNTGAATEWSIILKVLSPGSDPHLTGLGDPTHPLYWKREILAYQSGLLDTLPGRLVAPCCLGVWDQPDGSAWLWLEEARNEVGLRWPLQQFHRVAVDLGVLNGTYLVDSPLPDDEWLSRDGSPRGLLLHYRDMERVLYEPRIWAHPLVRPAFPEPVVDRLAALWKDRDILLDTFERLPRTLCHRDAWRRNIFAPADPARPIMMIDWAYIGHGVPGTDIADLFAPSFSLFGAEPATPSANALSTTIFEGYIEGLTRAGWQGEVETVRFAYATFAALKYGCLLFEMADVLDEDRYGRWEEITGHPMANVIAQKAELVYYLLDLADEARRLLPAVRESISRSSNAG